MIAALALATVLAVAAGPAAGRPPTVGMEGRVDVTIAGPPLEARPLQDKAPLILRIAAARPDGDATRYDLRYIGLVPGKHDLKRYLVRADGSPTDNVPPIAVEVAHLLPELHQGDLVPQEIQPLGFLGGYRGLMIGAIAAWLLLLLPLILAGRRRRSRAVAAPPQPPPTLAERLRPLVQRAADGALSAEGKGQLERLLLGYWRQRLDLGSLDMPGSLARLREHREAGQLLRNLEDWLHRPPGSVNVDVAAVLAPYHDAPANVTTPEESLVA